MSRSSDLVVEPLRPRFFRYEKVDASVGVQQQQLREIVRVRSLMNEHVIPGVGFEGILE